MSVDPVPADRSHLRLWAWGGREYWLGEFPWLMGIVNVTPDSFSDGGRFLDPKAAVEHGLRLVEEGADILDVGGESTRPGAEPVSAEEELRRVIPVIQRLAEQTTVPISVDTTKSVVAREAIQAGARIVNDISALRFDPRMVDVCAESDVGVVCMHIQGTPKTMQRRPHYELLGRDLLEYFRDLRRRLAGRLPEQRVVFDPGIGFGKTVEHNLALLANVRWLRSLGRPVLVGHSRKQFLHALLNRPVEERVWGTVGVSVALAAQRVDILRVHDVKAVRDALVAWRAVASRTDDLSLLFGTEEKPSDGHAQDTAKSS